MRTVPEPPPRPPPTAAELAGAAAGRDLPPRAPGTEGRAPRVSTLTEEPMVGPAAKLGEPSPLATAMVANDPAVAQRFRRLTQPGKRGPQDFTGMGMQDQRITTAFDTIIEGRKGLRLTDERGNPLPAGSLPRNLRQFSQAIEQLKDQLYDSYNAMAVRVGGQGVRVSLQPAVNRIRQMVNDPALRLGDKSIREWAEQQALTWEAEGSLSPKETQGYIKELNSKLERQIVGATGDVMGRNDVMAEVLKTLRNTQNETMNAALGGPQYQILRQRHGMLTSIEQDVGNALRKELAKRPGAQFLDRLVDYGSLATLAGGVFHFPVEAMGAAAAAEAGKLLYRYVRSPNRAVTGMFNARETAMNPYAGMTADISSRIASGYAGRYRPPPSPLEPYIGPSGM